MNEKMLNILKRDLEKINFFKKRHLLSAIKFTVLIILLVATHVCVIIFIDKPYYIIFVVLWGILAVQFGLFAHEAGHRAASNSSIVNKIYGYFSMPFVNGNNFTVWVDLHNQHHQYVQIENMDPDMDFKILLSVYPAQAKLKNKFLKKIQRFQQIYFWFISLFFSWSFRLKSFDLIIKNPKKMKMDSVLIISHYFVWLGIPAIFIGFNLALINYLFYSMVLSFYLAIIFSVNHIGLPTLSGVPQKMDFTKLQIEYSRNITNHKFLDFIFGGLNFQIEHHLFPGVSIRNLRNGSRIVSEFCKKNNFKYQTMCLLPALRQIYKHLYNMGRI